ncbi:hypothetical protein [Anaerolinea thermolimosa]|uniref:hypothetical protein n=1 Tax=Anaerolinea thermolimosa TaxID=229919 RepID=UPI000785081A
MAKAVVEVVVLVALAQKEGSSPSTRARPARSWLAEMVELPIRLPPQGQSGGIVTYSGVPAPVPSGPISAPAQEQPLAPTEALPLSVPLEGSGPILGIPSNQAAGQIIATSPGMPASASQPVTAPAPAPGEAFPARRLIQAILLGVALLAGVYTWFARRRI